jgi:hypothetical protein
MVINTEEEYDAAVEEANGIYDMSDDPWGNPRFIELTDAISAWDDVHYPGGDFIE